MEHGVVGEYGDGDVGREHEPVHLGAVGEQPLGEVGAVLPGDAR